MQLKKNSVNFGLSIFRLSAQVLSAKLQHHGFCLCCKQLSLQLQMQVLFNLVSGFRFSYLLRKLLFSEQVALLKDCRLCFLCVRFVQWLIRISIVWQGTSLETSRNVNFVRPCLFQLFFFIFPISVFCACVASQVVRSYA